jgi:phytoene dehydrogenase-like protein
VKSAYDVVVIGSGPNGLAAGIVAAKKGLSTLIIEARETVGGGLRSAELTGKGFLSDVCASVHPMGISSPFFRSLHLERYGFEWIVPPASAAHPLDDGSAAMMYNDAARTAESLGSDGRSYLKSIGSLGRDWPELVHDVLAPIGIPQNPLTFGMFATQGVLPATTFANLKFSTSRARALFAGCAAHSIIPLTWPASAGVALALMAVGHSYGWPIARAGSQSLADALASHFRSLGGEIETGIRIEKHEQLPRATHLFFDTAPRVMAQIMGDRLPAGFAKQMRDYKYGPGVFKIDWALSAPIPWSAKECLDSATVHVGGTLEEITAAEAAPWKGETSERPYVLVTQPSVFDSMRAPPLKHTAWGYCHVPNGSPVDMTDRIEAQIERFAPGFRDVVIARAVRGPATLEHDNPNLVGGDVGGGSNEISNLLMRPTWRMYSTPVTGVHLCSAATPPGAGVHGMCGYHAATRALGG